MFPRGIQSLGSITHFSFFALQLSIHISDENDNPPVFTQGIYTATIPENVPQGYSVTRVNTSDADIGINAEHSFTITGIVEPFERVLFS